MSAVKLLNNICVITIWPNEWTDEQSSHFAMKTTGQCNKEQQETFKSQISSDNFYSFFHYNFGAYLVIFKIWTLISNSRFYAWLCE